MALLFFTRPPKISQVFPWHPKISQGLSARLLLEESRRCKDVDYNIDWALTNMNCKPLLGLQTSFSELFVSLEVSWAGCRLGLESMLVPGHFEREKSCFIFSLFSNGSLMPHSIS